MNKVLGIAPEAEQTNLQAEVGESGVAHSLVMLAHALEDAKPGDKILVVSYGSGCDALCFEVTEEIKKVQDGRGISSALAKRADLDNYTKYLVWRNILPADLGKRGEEDSGRGTRPCGEFESCSTGFTAASAPNAEPPRFLPRTSV